jgi:hypothetical protein
MGGLLLEALYQTVLHLAPAFGSVARWAGEVEGIRRALKGSLAGCTHGPIPVDIFELGRAGSRSVVSPAGD